MSSYSTYESGSDDDAPEEFNAAEVRQQFVSQNKDFLQALKKGKLEEKEKRRKRNELFKAQKEKKIQDLMKRKLPQDILDAVSTKSLQQKQDKVNIKDHSVRKAKEEQEVQVDDRLVDSGVEDEGCDFDLHADFIPLKGTRNLFVATEDGVKKKKLTAAQEVLNFKNKHLYNQSVIPRENCKKRKDKLARLKMLKAQKKRK